MLWAVVAVILRHSRRIPAFGHTAGEAKLRGNEMRGFFPFAGLQVRMTALEAWADLKKIQNMSANASHFMNPLCYICVYRDVRPRAPLQPTSNFFLGELL